MRLPTSVVEFHALLLLSFCRDFAEGQSFLDSTDGCFGSSSSLCNFESNKHVHLLFSICLLQVEALICLILSGCECSNDLKCFEMAVTGNYISVQCEK